MRNQPAGLEDDNGGADKGSSGATDQRLIGPGGYALALVYCFGISSLPPTQHSNRGSRELGPYPGRESVGYTTVYPRTPAASPTPGHLVKRRAGAATPPARA